MSTRSIRSRFRQSAGPIRPKLEELEDRWLPSVLTVTSIADNGPGSLRVALATAADGDEIDFNLPNPSTIHLTSGTLNTPGVTIHGPGSGALTINGNGTFTIFTIVPMQGFTSISGITISGGGGASGGGMLNQDFVTLSDCVITGNQVTGAAGGIENDGLLNIKNCTISHNIAGTFGGGIVTGFGMSMTITSSTISLNSAVQFGGGIEADSTGNTTILSSTISNNSVTAATAGNGGGAIALFGSNDMTLVNDSISNNAVTGASSLVAVGGGEALGGGIECSNASITAIGCAFVGNQVVGGHGRIDGALGEGGGIGLGNAAVAVLTNCTLANNRAVGGSAQTEGGNAIGGGMSWFDTNAGSGDLTNCTIAHNSVQIGNGVEFGPMAGGGGIASDGTQTNNVGKLVNTLVAANTVVGASEDDVLGDILLAVNDLIGVGTGNNIANGGGNQVGTAMAPINPMLNVLANYGGPTETLALLPGSPAINAGANGRAQTDADQRGFARIVGGIVDIGAYEFQPFHLLAVGADLGGGPEVKVYEASTGKLRFDFDAYESTFTGGVRVAVADINGDGIPDIITAPGGVKVTLVNVYGALQPQFDFSAGRAPEVKVFSGVDGSVIDDFIAYRPSFRAGLFVAVADVNGDGKPDIITAPDATGQSGHTQVSVFFNGSLINTGASLAPDRQFNAYDPGFGGGVRLAAADINADGFADIVTAPGIWSGPDIRVFDGKTLTNNSTASKIGEFLAYDFRYFGGVFVATGDVNGDALPDIITGTNGNGGPEVKAFSGLNVLTSPTPTIVDDFFAYDPAFNGGARVAVLDVNGDGKADIITGAGAGGGPHVRIFDGGTGQQLQTNTLDSFMAFDPAFSGGVFIGAA